MALTSKVFMQMQRPQSTALEDEDDILANRDEVRPRALLIS